MRGFVVYIFAVFVASPAIAASQTPCLAGAAPGLPAEDVDVVAEEDDLWELKSELKSELKNKYYVPLSFGLTYMF